MICGDCREAGSLLTQIQDLLDNPSETDLEAVRVLHRKCKSGSFCTCQHRVELGMLNMERINREQLPEHTVPD